VGVADALEHLYEEGDGALHGEAPDVANQCAERVALHVLHHHEEPVGALDQAVERGDVRVVELSQGVGLGAEALDELAALRQVGAQELDGDIAAQDHVPGPVHLAHAAFGDQLVDAIVLDLLPKHPGGSPPLDPRAFLSPRGASRDGLSPLRQRYRPLLACS
jgi:hypothetical protein